MRKVFLLLLFLPNLIFAQESKTPQKFSPMEYFLGKWESTSHGKPGKGQGNREYKYEVGTTYIMVKSESRFEPTDKNPQGEVHIDWGFISFDGFRKKFVYRQFNIEGYVNQYVADLSTDKRIVFETEVIENVPAGFKARNTIEILDENTFREGFELAPPGKEYTGCVYNTWKRE
jgi:hypothetical protein